MVNLGAQDHYVVSAKHESLYDEEDLYDDFYMPSQRSHAGGILSDPTVERISTLEQKLKAMERFRCVDMCLVSGLIIPQKFKVPDFDKYKGVSFPRTNLRAYCRKMVAYTNNNKLIIHYF